MTVLSELQLARLEAAWRRAGADIVDHLAPGLSRDEMLSATEEFPELHLSEDALAWWGWHNGITVPAAHFGGSRAFESFEDNLSYYKELGEFTPGIFPLCFGSPPLGLDCRAPNGSASEIVAMHHGSPIELLGITLSQLVDLWAEFIENGIWRFGPEDGAEALIDESGFSENDPRLMFT